MVEKGFPVYNKQGMKIGYFKDKNLDIDNIMFVIQDEIDNLTLLHRRY